MIGPEPFGNQFTPLQTWTLNVPQWFSVRWFLKQLLTVKKIGHLEDIRLMAEKLGAQRILEYIVNDHYKKKH